MNHVKYEIVKNLIMELKNAKWEVVDQYEWHQTCTSFPIQRLVAIVSHALTLLANDFNPMFEHISCCW